MVHFLFPFLFFGEGITCLLFLLSLGHEVVFWLATPTTRECSQRKKKRQVIPSPKKRNGKPTQKRYWKWGWSVRATVKVSSGSTFGWTLWSRVALRDQLYLTSIIFFFVVGALFPMALSFVFLLFVFFLFNFQKTQENEIKRIKRKQMKNKWAIGKKKRRLPHKEDEERSERSSSSPEIVREP